MTSSCCAGPLSDKMDVISQLPANVKDLILECLPIQDAGRTALLSTHWNQVWLQHGRLEFDIDFCKCVSKYKDYDKKNIALVNIINKILMLRAGPVKKFTMRFRCDDFQPEQSDIDLWCLFLSRNGVEELNISAYDIANYYELPHCIVSCRTIKKLILYDFSLDVSKDAQNIFPSVTSLVLEFSEYLYLDDEEDEKAVVFRIPNLEELTFIGCDYINECEIIAPKLKSLSIIGRCGILGIKSRWFTHHLSVIQTLCMEGELLSSEAVVVAAPTFPIALNLHVIRLYDLSFGCGKQLMVAMQLFQKCPNLCDLKISAKNFSESDDKEAASRLLEDPDCSFINKDMKMLNTVKIKRFNGSRLEMHFLKSLLSKSPALEKIVIKKYGKIDTSRVVKIQRELLRFPCASPKAQILFLD